MIMMIKIIVSILVKLKQDGDENGNIKENDTVNKTSKRENEKNELQHVRDSNY